MVSMRRGERGLTFVEVACALFGFAVLGGGMAAVMGTGVNVWKGSQSMSVIDRDANRGMRGITDQLAWAGRGSAVASFGEETVVSSIEFLPVAGVSEGQVTWGAPRRIEWVADTNDPTDGVDNNGNGVVDEGAVLLVLNAGLASEARSLIVRGVGRYLEGELPNGLDDNGNGLVDEPGLCFVRRGNGMVVHLTIHRVGMDGQALSRTVETSVTPRN